MRISKITLLLLLLAAVVNLMGDEISDKRKRSVSAFPILMYDLDIGLGFGGKGVLKNQFRLNESFDLMLFGSTKGEQRYFLIFSIPDFEIRQGTVYPLAFDLKIDWNKLLNSNYFGIGNDSEDNSYKMPREMIKVKEQSTQKILAYFCDNFMIIKRN